MVKIAVWKPAVLSWFDRYIATWSSSDDDYITTSLYDLCKENGPLTHLLWILVFDDQHNQIGLMNLQVFVL